jgi:surfactin synthase thioesterase subunit
VKHIYLFPYGGGSASSYRSYARSFPRDTGLVVPVELPGRGGRSGEGFARSVRECAALTLQQIDTAAGQYVLHGHCMGALLAFEAIKLIEASGGPLPHFMIASGRNAPRHVNDWLRRVAELDDRDLFAELQERGGVPKGLSFGMAQGFLAVLRSDHAMFRGYDPGEARISVPVLVLAGEDDNMTNAAALADWEDYTSKFVAIEWLEGRHYFLFDQTDRIVDCVKEFGKQVDALALAESRQARFAS